MYERLLPPDATREDLRIINTLAVTLYQRLDDPIDKFIVAMVFDMGYPREDTARALNMSYVTVYKRINEIRDKLRDVPKPECDDECDDFTKYAKVKEQS